jgi:hypothetical protein
MVKKPTEPTGTSATQRGLCLAERYQFVPEPERLVGLGFRYWMAGQLHGDVGYWERAWRLYTGAFGLTGGKLAIEQLSSWVGAVSTSKQRAIEVETRACGRFCRDECVAISLIAACQHRTCPALRACAFALLECSQIDAVIGEAQGFADTLMGLDTVLMPGLMPEFMPGSSGTGPALGSRPIGNLN